MLRTTAGDLGYDHLVIAAGGQTNYFGNTRLAGTAFGLKDLDDAVRLRNHVLTMFEPAGHEQRPELRQAAASLVSGQADEGLPLVLVRGLPFKPEEDASARGLVRPLEQDLFR